MSAHVLGDKDVNAAMEQQQQSKDLKSMDYHRQVLQSKMAEEPYVHRKTAPASSSRSTAATASRPFASSSRRLMTVFARNTANSSDTSSCCPASSSSSSSSSSPSSASPIPSLISDAASSSSASPTPSITALPPRFLPTNKFLVGRTKQYVSPSDNIMSPCSAKINALRNKQVSKAKPKSLFAQASAKKLGGDNLFGSKSIPKD